jgi:hypothetical protein
MISESGLLRFGTLGRRRTGIPGRVREHYRGYRQARNAGSPPRTYKGKVFLKNCRIPVSPFDKIVTAGQVARLTQR